MDSNENKLNAIARIEEAIQNINDNNFTIFFFTVDTKNVPNGSVAYIYQLAKTLQDKGYNVKMLYQLENAYTEGELYKLRKKDAPIDENRVFTGVGDWLGKEYAELPHMNIASEQWTVSPSDFLFIPEVFSSLMSQTFKYKAPCKRYVILQNYNYVTEFIPFGTEWKNYGIYDVLANTETQANLIKSVFPYVRTKVLSPYIPEYFREPVEAKKLVINVVAKNKDHLNRIIKPFYWKYPIYKFVSFQDVRNFPREHVANLLKESAITVWIDEESPFGYSALEAIKCGNILIGVIPKLMPEWLADENGDIKDCGLWTYDINQIPDMIAKAVGMWLQDAVPTVLTEGMNEIKSKYTYETWQLNAEETIKSIIDEHVNSLKEVKGNIKNNLEKEEGETQEA